MNRFREKYRSKTSEELKLIAEDARGIYELEARQVAAELLREKYTKQEELESLKNIETELNELLDQSKMGKCYNPEILILNLKKIRINSTVNISIESGKNLQIWRISKDLFQVRIATYKSELAPVVICQITSEHTYRFFPFPYVKGMLMMCLMCALLMLFLLLFDTGFRYVDLIWYVVPVSLGFQIFMTPIAYYMILKSLKESLGTINNE